MQNVATDLFATKGIEYMLVIAYLVLLVACWRFIFPRASHASQPAEAQPEPVSRWFFLPDGFYFHQGHAWAAPLGEHVMRVGMDDFAQKLLGLTASVELPEVGEQLAQGEIAWQVRLVDGHALPMVSPVEGEVIAINPEVLKSPSLVNSEPYDGGWLFQVRVINPMAARRNLLSGDLARVWIEAISEKLGDVRGAELGIVLPDGTVGNSGIARAISPHEWERVARHFLLMEERWEQSTVEEEVGAV